MALCLVPAVPAGPSPLVRRTFGLALAITVLIACVVPTACGTDVGRTAGSATPLGGPTVSASPSPADQAGASPAQPSAAAGVVEAAAVVRRFCRLVDEHRHGAALRLLAAPGVWPLRELRTIRRLRFESVKAWGAPTGREVTLLVTFTADVTWRSPLTNGLNDVFFTLTRRVTTGEWLIAAVSTSP
jgi:hypothetical protein